MFFRLLSASYFRDNSKARMINVNINGHIGHDDANDVVGGV